VLAAGNSINLVQLTKRANKLGYHTYVGKGMVLVCAAADTKGKLSENACETVSTANFHNAMTGIIAYQPSTTQAAMLGINMVAKLLCSYCIVYILQGLPLETYVAAYKYGSVVIFNGREREKEVLKLCQEFCTEPTKQNYTEGEQGVVLSAVHVSFIIMRR